MVLCLSLPSLALGLLQVATEALKSLYDSENLSHSFSINQVAPTNTNFIFV